MKFFVFLLLVSTLITNEIVNIDDIVQYTFDWDHELLNLILFDDCSCYSRILRAYWYIDKLFDSVWQFHRLNNIRNHYSKDLERLYWLCFGKKINNMKMIKFFFLLESIIESNPWTVRISFLSQSFKWFRVMFTNVSRIISHV